MISDDDKRELSDVVLRALDDIDEDFGDDAELRGATLVLEVTVGGDSHGRYKSMPRTTSAHAVGMLTMAANYIGSPIDEDDDE